VRLSRENFTAKAIKYSNNIAAVYATSPALFCELTVSAAWDARRRVCRAGHPNSNLK
jgi:hypothetical protein